MDHIVGRILTVFARKEADTIFRTSNHLSCTSTFIAPLTLLCTLAGVWSRKARTPTTIAKRAARNMFFHATWMAVYIMRMGRPTSPPKSELKTSRNSVRRLHDIYTLKCCLKEGLTTLRLSLSIHGVVHIRFA